MTAGNHYLYYANLGNLYRPAAKSANEDMDLTITPIDTTKHVTVHNKIDALMQFKVTRVLTINNVTFNSIDSSVSFFGDTATQTATPTSYTLSPSCMNTSATCLNYDESINNFTLADPSANFANRLNNLTCPFFQDTFIFDMRRGTNANYAGGNKLNLNGVKFEHFHFPLSGIIGWSSGSFQMEIIDTTFEYIDLCGSIIQPSFNLFREE